MSASGEPAAPATGVARAVARLTPGLGALVLVVGPSGSGKDTLIRWVRDNTGDRRLVFVRRTVTRAADRASEDHHSLPPAAFAEAESQGAFAVAWDAHGLRYGLPASLCDDLDAGRIAIANGSRQALPVLRRAFGNLVVVHLEVAADILARRLAGRGREAPERIAARLERGAAPVDAGDDVVRVDNSRAIEAAGGAVLALVDAAAAQIGLSDPEVQGGRPRVF